MNATRKRPFQYHPGRSPDNAKAIASGDLQVLVDFLCELSQIPWRNPDPQARNTLLLDRSMAATQYAAALVAHLADKGRGQPREYFTMTDAVRAAEAAGEYKRLKGTRPAMRLEKEIMTRFGVSRSNLRAALKGKLPQVEMPGIPSADK